MQELVHPVGETHEYARPVGARDHARGERAREAAFQVDVAVEIGFEKADMAKERHAAIGARTTKDDRELGRRGSRAPLGAVGVAQRERGAGALGDDAEGFLYGGSQGIADSTAR
jgi:hypothetical protein